MMINKMRAKGIGSQHMYLAGFATMGMSMLGWMTSMFGEAEGAERACRWGVFMGQLTPAFLAIGLALRLEETHPEHREGMERETMERETMEREGMPGQTPSGMRPRMRR